MMALPPVLPNPSNFLGVALVINRNRDGPRFVFHYPSRIPPPQDVQQKEFNAGQADDDVRQAEGSTSAGLLGGSRDFMPNAGELARWNHEDHLVADNGTQFVPWEYVVGFPTKALEGILTPPRAFHKKRFQIGLDSVCYVSYPVHVPPSGHWDKSRNRKGRSKKAKTSSDRGRCPEEGSTRGGIDAEDKEDKASSMTMFSLVFILSPKRHEATELLDMMYLHIVREVNKVYKYCQESGDFVWQECKRIIQLKDRARENRMKMSLLWKEILAVSSLAASMRDIYEAVCRNRIAVLELSLGKGSVGHSVQIPIPFYVGDVQPQGSEMVRSLWLTTANTVSQYDTLGGLAALDRCFALLLTDDDDKKIIAELHARGDKAAAAMIEFVKASKPTLSLHQIAQLPETMLTIQQVRAYAQHFIYWRKAMAIPPLHARDVYVVSPNCDITNIACASSSFHQAFPFAPPLPDLLAGLSSAPRPFKSFCPTKSLRPAYLRILAWLVRGGWVCQLCTFAYVVVWPEIQYEVEYNLESEDLARVKHWQQRDSDKENSPKLPVSLIGEQDSDNDHQAGQYSTRSDLLDSRDNVETGATSDISDTASTLLSSSRHDRATNTPSFHGRLAAEQVAERARRQRIAEKAAHNLAERATAHARKPIPELTNHPSVNGAAHLIGILPHVILDASKPTGRESLYLSAIERRLFVRPVPSTQSNKGKNLKSTLAATTAISVSPIAAKGDTVSQSKRSAAAHRTLRGHNSDETTAWNGRAGEMWPHFWRYFNGHSALERIALLEDMKRKDVWGLLSSMSEHLLCVRHW